MNKLPATIDECHKIIKLLSDELNHLSKRFDVLEIEINYYKIILSTYMSCKN